MCCYYGKDFGDDSWSRLYDEEEDSELVTVVAHAEAEKFPVGQVTADMEVGIFHIDNRKPGPRHWDNQCQHHHMEFGFPDKGIECPKIYNGVLPSTLLRDEEVQ